MSLEPLDFLALKEEERGLQSNVESHILILFESAINSSPEPNIIEKAENFVTALLSCRLEKYSGVDARSFTMTTWHVLIHIASCIPIRHHGQDVLVKVLGKLDNAGESWKFLPGFEISLRQLDSVLESWYVLKYALEGGVYSIAAR